MPALARRLALLAAAVLVPTGLVLGALTISSDTGAPPVRVEDATVEMRTPADAEDREPAPPTSPTSPAQPGSPPPPPAPEPAQPPQPPRPVQPEQPVVPFDYDDDRDDDDWDDDAGDDDWDD